LEDHLRQDYDIVYLVCHGVFIRNEPRLLLLANEGGAYQFVSGKEMVEAFAGQLNMPRLVVLSSCQSAGTGCLQGDDAAGLVALGPRLAEIGVPAVVAMHGNLQEETQRQFMPRFFKELFEEKYGGQIERAMTLARNEVKNATDCWVPVLFT